ncbi:MAG TPA: PHP domain-containing protein [Syntrophomonadaceae bacterium]|nr:PHP domain-containing protein [Syntrophomonadaceae bacterium]
MYDLHVHSTASDGLLTPEEVLLRAQEIGLAGIALTDHDTISGIEAAQKYRVDHGLTLEFIPGIEMNTEVDETEVHILGYYIDHHDNRLLNKLEEIREARLERARKMVYRLKSMGLAISFDHVEKLARGDLIGRPHVAQALTEKGYVFSIKEAFEKYIGKGKPAYVPRYKFLPQEAIQLIKNAGGVPVLAHPGLLRNRELIQEAINLGVAGLEVYYPDHTLEQVAEYLHLCQHYHLLVTGGSDFHGTDSDESRCRLGCTGIDLERYRQLYSYHHKKNIPS